MKRYLYLRLPLPLFLLLPCFVQAQTLRGTVHDAESRQPLTGATVALESGRPGVPPLSVATTPEGLFLFENIRAGYYRLTVSMEGFETQRIAELSVASGKEQVLELLLQRSAANLPEATIVALSPGRRSLLPIGELPLTREQTLRFPATFFDPARLAAAYPGVAQTDDGTNSLSIRGNSPSSVRWRLEGADIVSPNHLPNAGTFSDRPATASGGVLMFSAQLLDNSSLLTGVMPASYGDAIGGVMDMYLRRGNNRKHEFTAQAGLIGLDMAAEGPLGNQKDPNGLRPASYLVNYRYSTVGLLGQLGVSFGNEQINFQDLSFNVGFKGKKGSRWTVFGLGGLSENTFKHKADSSEIKAYKDFFDIDFRSKTGVIGFSNLLQAPHGLWLKVSGALSGQGSDRASSSPVFPERASTDDLSETVASLALTMNMPLNARFNWQMGALETVRWHQATSVLEGEAYLPIETRYVINQPWFELSWKNVQKTTEADLGLNMYSLAVSYQAEKYINFDPRASFSQRLGRHRLIAAAGYFSEAMPFWVVGASNLSGHRSLKVSLGYAWAISEDWTFRAELFRQRFDETPFFGETHASLANMSDYRPFPRFQQLFSIASIPGGRNRGAEIMLERKFSGGWFGNLNATFVDSKYPTILPVILRQTLVPSRWDIGHVANLVFGKEWQREKSPGRERSIGLNGRAVWAGGVREAQIKAESRQLRTTVFDETLGFTNQYPDYFRLDLRVYWRRYLGDRRNSTFALEFQNLTNRLNLAYHYYDPYTDRVETKFQLGTIPNFSWRVEF